MTAPYRTTEPGKMGEDGDLACHGRSWLHREPFRASDACRAGGCPGDQPGKITYAGVPENLADVEDHPRCEFHRGDLADPNAVGPLVRRAVLEYLDKPQDLIEKVRDRPGHVRRDAESAEKLKAATGGSPRWTLERGLPETVRWYESHTDWWQRIKEGEYREYYEKMYASR